MRTPMCIAGTKIKYNGRRYVVASISYNKKYDEFIYYLVKQKRYRKNINYDGDYDLIVSEELFERELEYIDTKEVL